MSSPTYYEPSVLKKLFALLITLVLSFPLIGAETIPSISIDSYGEISEIQKTLDDEKFIAGLKLAQQYLNKKTISAYEKAIGLG